MTSPNDAGESMVRYVLDSEIFSQLVKVAPPNGGASSVVLADPADQYQVGAPSNGDLWVMYVHPGDIVKEGEELFNVSIMKQEKAVLAPVAGIVKRVLKTADYKETRKMVTVREGELIVELGPVPRLCTNEACRPSPADGRYRILPLLRRTAQPACLNRDTNRYEESGDLHDENSFRNQKQTRRGSGGRSSANAWF
ncbi:MAG: biotin/lipoyl-containing protein [Bilophila sp.]